MNILKRLILRQLGRSGIGRWLRHVSTGRYYVYLAGSMQAPDDGGVEWRKRITPKLEEMGMTVLDPTKIESEEYGDMDTAKSVIEGYLSSGNMAAFDSYMDRVQKRDIKAVEMSDFIVVRGHDTGGTISEIHHHCFVMNKPAYVISTSALTSWNYWVLRSVRRVGIIFPSEAQLLSYVEGRYGKR